MKHQFNTQHFNINNKVVNSGARKYTRMQTQLLILVIGTFAFCSALPAESSAKFIDYDLYKIENRFFPEGVLTVIVNPFNLTELPRLFIWGDDAGQKWRLESSKLYSAFQLRPSSYESFVLEQEEKDTFLQWVTSFTHFGSQKLWYLNDAGSGFTQIKNKQFDTCLGAIGIEKPIFAVPCINTPEQQWKFTKLS